MRTGSTTSTPPAGNVPARGPATSDAVPADRPFAAVLDQSALARPARGAGSDASDRMGAAAHLGRDPGSPRTADAGTAKNEEVWPPAGHTPTTTNRAARPAARTGVRLPVRTESRPDAPPEARPEAAATDAMPQQTAMAASDAADDSTAPTVASRADESGIADTPDSSTASSGAAASPASGAGAAAKPARPGSNRVPRSEQSDAGPTPASNAIAQPAWLLAGLPLAATALDGSHAKANPKPGAVSDRADPAIDTAAAAAAAVVSLASGTVGGPSVTEAGPLALTAAAIGVAHSTAAVRDGAVSVPVTDAAAPATGGTGIDAGHDPAANTAATAAFAVGTAAVDPFASRPEARNPSGTEGSSPPTTGTLDDRTRAGAGAADLAALAGLSRGLPGGGEPPANARSIAVPVSEPAWRQALAAQLQMFAAAKVQTATLKLSPEHLGPLEVHMDLQSSQLNVSFVALHPETRSALEQSVPTLRALLAGGGLTLGHTEVQGESRSGSQTPGQHRAASLTGDTPAHEIRAAGPVRTIGLIDEYV